MFLDCLSLLYIYIYIYTPNDRVVYSRDRFGRDHLYLERIGSSVIITKVDIR